MSVGEFTGAGMLGCTQPGKHQSSTWNRLINITQVIYRFIRKLEKLHWHKKLKHNHLTNFWFNNKQCRYRGDSCKANLKIVTFISGSLEDHVHVEGYVLSVVTEDKNFTLSSSIWSKIVNSLHCESNPSQAYIHG